MNAVEFPVEIIYNDVKYKTAKSTNGCKGCAFLPFDAGCDFAIRHVNCAREGTLWVESGTKNKTEPKSMILPTDAQERKSIPIVSGFLDYFPLAVAEVAKCSLKANEQHNPGEPLYWNRNKSTDHIECIGRHLIDRETYDTDGVRHATKLAWRAMAYLQILLENEMKGKE